MSLQNVAWKTAISLYISFSLYPSRVVASLSLSLSPSVWLDLTLARISKSVWLCGHKSKRHFGKWNATTILWAYPIYFGWIFSSSFLGLILDEGHTFLAVYTFECKLLCLTSHSIALSFSRIICRYFCDHEMAIIISMCRVHSPEKCQEIQTLLRIVRKDKYE